MTSSSSNEAPRARVSSSASLRVVTWNVGEVYWPWHGNQLKDRDVEAVIDVLGAIDADVVLLQELAHEGQLARIASMRDATPRYAGGLPLRCGYDRHVGVLVRAQLRPRFEHELLAPTRRGVVWAQFELAGLCVRAFSLHFDVFQPARRLQQARTAGALIGEPGALVIAGGDFNYDPEASRRLGRELDHATEAALGSRLVDVAPDSGPTLVGLLRVDRMFAGGSALLGSRASVYPGRLPLGDHAPLVCDLALWPSESVVVDASG